MKVKLNPLWWFQSYESYLRVIVLFVILCISAFCTMEKDHALFSIIFSAVLALVFWLIVLLSDFPYSFDLENGTLRYRYTHRIHKYKRSRYVRTELIITQIQRVKVRQNALEKLFNTGHVTFEGKAKPHYLREYKESYKESTERAIPTKHTFYGIKHFDKFRNEIYNHVDPTILTINVER